MISAHIGGGGMTVDARIQIHATLPTKTINRGLDLGHLHRNKQFKLPITELCSPQLCGG
jgi:hypothetical protein